MCSRISSGMTLCRTSSPGSPGREHNVAERDRTTRSPCRCGPPGRSLDPCRATTVRGCAGATDARDPRVAGHPAAAGAVPCQAAQPEPGGSPGCQLLHPGSRKSRLSVMHLAGRRLPRTGRAITVRLAGGNPDSPRYEQSGGLVAGVGGGRHASGDLRVLRRGEPAAPTVSHSRSSRRGWWSHQVRAAERRSRGPVVVAECAAILAPAGRGGHTDWSPSPQQFPVEAGHLLSVARRHRQRRACPFGTQVRGGRPRGRYQRAADDHSAERRGAA
jgi:hypothetical protein